LTPLQVRGDGVLEEEELGRLHRLAEKSVDGEEAAAAARKWRTVKAHLGSSEDRG
jgi:hypothetical protein